MKHLFFRFAALLCITSFVTVAGVEASRVGPRVRSLDQNRDGRPDAWQHVDAHGQVTEIDIDSNFDGKPDISEYYERGTLVRRESDRNFNGQADLVEDFDAITHQRVRSVIDLDFDGTADLLVLFRDGRPVFSKRTSAAHASSAPRPQVAGRRSRLIPLTDPFESDNAIRATLVFSGDESCVAFSTCGSLPMPTASTVVALVPSAAVVIASGGPHLRSFFLPRSPRAPPALS